MPEHHVRAYVRHTASGKVVHVKAHMSHNPHAMRHHMSHARKHHRKSHHRR